MSRFTFAVVSVFSVWSNLIVAQETNNLLVRPDIVFMQQQSAGIDLSSALLISDENLETASVIEVTADSPVELVYSLSGSIVTPTALRLQVASLEKNRASIEVLVSEQGPDTGYLSLRAEPLTGNSSWQRFTFEPAAAKWLMIKINAFAANTRFDLKELEIEGYEGAPVSLYAFDEAPADALAVLKGLEQSSLSFDIHQDEKSLFDDASDGTLDSWTFAEASLLSSGVYDSESRKQYLSQIDDLTKQAKSIVSAEPDKFSQGRLLLEWLHSGEIRNGYIELQTDMSSVLDEQHFNCVSSSTLYNIIARRLGLDARGIEVPDHAFSILYNGTDHVDVETTTPQGFDPARNRAALNAFSRTTGYTYISDKNRSKRRELDDAGTVALTYYNHGVSASEEGDYPRALLSYFRALSLDPRNKSAVKNTLAALGSWSNESIENKDFNRAVEILDVALNFAPQDRTTRHNMRYVAQEAMLAATTDTQSQSLAAIATDVYTRTQDKTFLRLQSQVLQSKAYVLAENGEFERALQLAEVSGNSVDESGQRNMQRFRASLFLNWSNNLLDAKNYSQATDVLQRALDESGKDHRLKNNIAYVAQEWSASVAASEGAQASQNLLHNLSDRFPDISAVEKLAASNYDQEAHDAFNAGDFETAISIYQTAQKLGVGGNHMARNEKAAWNNWGLSQMDQGNYSAALTIFERARVAHPSDSSFKNNITYIVQEWGKAINVQNGVTAAESAIALQRQRFADVSQLNQLQGSFINQAVNSANTAGDFQTLQSALQESGEYAANQSQYNKLVAYFYQEWATTAHPDFQDDAAIVILQSGVEAHPDNREVKKMFIYAVNKFGGEAANANDTQGALSIFQSAARSLPQERTFLQNIEALKQRQ